MDKLKEEEETAAELIWDGKLVKEDNHLEELRKRFLERLSACEDAESIQRGMKVCKTPHQRIQFIQNYFQWVNIPTPLTQRLSKNPRLSIGFRERANAKYKAGNVVGARRGYNLAVSFGRTGEEELGLAYANRSALFLQIKEPELALRDIRLALENSFPQSLRPVLLERERKCQDNARDQKERESSREAEDFCNKAFFTLKCPSESIVGAESFVQIVSSTGRGRCLQVSQDVKAGSTLLVEKPYVTMLERELSWDTEHCQHCLKRILGGIPCTHCTFAMYCDEQCRQDANLYHQYEHQLWGYLHGIEASRRDLLATRIIAKLGPSQLYQLFRDDSSLSTGSVPGFGHQGVYDSTEYKPIYHLVAHTEGQELCDEVSHAFKALLLTHLLHEQTDFFRQISTTENLTPDVQGQFLTYTAGIILHHLESIPFNAISLSELQRDNGGEQSFATKNQDNSIKSVCYASAVFGLLAMSNHSCSPNAIHVRRGGGDVTALVALRNLHAGEEVCITYGPLFTVHPFDLRQSTLKTKYNFDCDCDACTHGWTVSDTLGSEVVKNPIVLVKLSEYENVLKEVHEKLAEEVDLVGAMTQLLPCLQYFGEHFPATFALRQVAQDLFKKALVCIANSNLHLF